MNKSLRLMIVAFLTLFAVIGISPNAQKDVKAAEEGFNTLSIFVGDEDSPSVQYYFNDAGDFVIPVTEDQEAEITYTRSFMLAWVVDADETPDFVNASRDEVSGSTLGPSTSSGEYEWSGTIIGGGYIVIRFTQQDNKTIGVLNWGDNSWAFSPFNNPLFDISEDVELNVTFPEAFKMRWFDTSDDDWNNPSAFVTAKRDEVSGSTLGPSTSSGEYEWSGEVKAGRLVIYFGASGNGSASGSTVSASGSNVTVGGYVFVINNTNVVNQINNGLTVKWTAGGHCLIGGNAHSGEEAGVVWSFDDSVNASPVAPGANCPTYPGFHPNHVANQWVAGACGLPGGCVRVVPYLQIGGALFRGQAISHP